jgi:hypothetical protein
MREIDPGHIYELNRSTTPVPPPVELPGSTEEGNSWHATGELRRGEGNG